MRVAWVPTVCTNPPGDAYYACYPAFLSQFGRGVDLTPVLAAGTTFSFVVPPDALDGRPATAGAPANATLVAFAMSCAGHVEYLGEGPASSPEAVPFGCFDAQHQQLGPDAFVFAFARVFVFADRTNEDPTIDHLVFDGAPVDPGTGITMDHCAVPEAAKCPTKSLDTAVPSSSQEPDPSAVDPQGMIEGEEIWVDYYLTAGSVKNDLRLLYDPVKGQVPSSADALTAPQAPAEGVLFAVVHDNRGGVSWAQVPLHFP
jgi:hypothetical protein